MLNNKGLTQDLGVMITKLLDELVDDLLDYYRVTLNVIYPGLYTNFP